MEKSMRIFIYLMKYGEWDLKTDDRSNMAYFEFLLKNWGGINVRVEWEKLNWVHSWVWVEISNETEEDDSSNLR